jgi:outer membrane immunogenic protein
MNVRECEFEMRVFVFGSLLIAALAAMKSQEVLAAPPVAVANWTGFYVGGNIGWGGARESAIATAIPSPGFGAPGILFGGVAGYGLLPTSYGLGRDGLLGGVHAGYNWQMMQWLVGIEGDFVFLNAKASESEALLATFPGAPTPTNAILQVTAKNDWLASARLRLGYVWNNLLLYGTAGAAWTEASYRATFNGPGSGVAAFPAGSAASSSFSKTSTGYVVGGGLEWMILQNWLLRVEYLHYGFDNATGNVPFTGGNCTLAAANCSWNIGTTHLQFDTVRAGVSYKF